MVQQLWSDIEKLKTEIRRLRGELKAISIGTVLISTPGGASVPTAIQGALMRGNASPGWERLVASVPAANVRNVVGLDNGDTLPSWKTTLDATAPTTAAFGDAPAAGTSLIYSHRDHRHGMPASPSDDVFIINMALGM